MKKLKVIILMIISIALVTSIVSASFLIVTNKISTNVSSESTDKFRIRFLDNNEEKKVMYVDSNYNLSLKDAPYYFDSSNNPIKWVCGDIILNAFENTISNNMDFVKSSFSSDEIITENLQNGNDKTAWYQNGHENNIDKFNSDYNSAYVYNGSMTLYYNQSDELTSSRTSGIAWHGTQSVGIFQNDDLLNNDSYIGLEAGTNNCEYTLKLDRDIILTGNITIGGRTGFYGNNHSYSQISYQGFIVGNYASIDLNGHDLIVGDPNDGAMLDVWGQITDTNSDKKGTLILDNNSTMYAVMAIEDVYHEKRMPYTYYSNDNLFSMYRCPYWQCNTIIKSGSNIYGKYMIDLGGDNTNMIKGDFKLIGKIDGLIRLESGFINRYIAENPTIKALKDVYEKDWLYQEINYDAYDANITFDKFIMPFEYSGLNANMDSTGYDFFISPYYNFKLYNTTLNLNQHLVFMPGSSFYMDDNCILNLSYLQSKSMGEISASGITIPTKHWQSSAGFTFIDKMYLMNDIKTFLNKVGEDNIEGYKCVIYSSRSKFWSSLESAYGEIRGKINFIKQDYDQYTPIQFGGKLNIMNLESFKNSFEIAKNADIKVRLYSSTFKTDWCRIFGGGGTSKKNIYRDVTGYYNYPLVSNDYVLMDPKDSGGETFMDLKTVGGNGYKYNWDAKLIYQENNNQEAYAFIFATNDLNNVALCNDLNAVDSLVGTYQKVVISNITQPAIICDGNNRLLFNGVYLPQSGSGYSVAKFIDNSIYSQWLNWTFKWDDTNNKWIPNTSI